MRLEADTTGHYSEELHAQVKAWGLSLPPKGTISVRSLHRTLMKWYYESNGHPHGPVDEAELRQLRDDGKIPGDALVWRQGMLDWAPLGEVNDFASRPAPLTSPQQALLQHETSKISPPLGPSGSDNGAEDTDRDRTTLPLGNSPTASASARPEWEHLEQVGPLGAFVTSIREISLDPEGTFSNIPQQGGWGKPLLFLAIAEVIGNILLVSSVRQIAFSSSPWIAFLKQALPPEKGGALLASSVASLLMLPLAIVIKTILIHASLKLVAQSAHSFATTFRTLCYAFGAGSMLWGVPFLAVSITSWAGEPESSVVAFLLATFVIGMWTLWINVKALARAHQVSTLRTVASLLLPPCVVIAATFLILGPLAALFSRG